MLIGTTLFVRATTSAVKRAIRRPDGPDENAYTVLLSQLVRHYSPALLRFDEDTTRAARDDLSSGVLADTCIGRGTKVQFGTGQQWDPQDPMQQQMLKQLLGFGALDDHARRRKLSGKRLQKLVSGGAPRPSASSHTATCTPGTSMAIASRSMARATSPRRSGSSCPRCKRWFAYTLEESLTSISDGACPSWGSNDVARSGRNS